jgi:hypothetical protein
VRIQPFPQERDPQACAYFVEGLLSRKGAPKGAKTSVSDPAIYAQRNLLIGKG